MSLEKTLKPKEIREDLKTQIKTKTEKSYKNPERK